MKTYISILLMFVSSLIFSQSIDIINPVEKIGIDNWSIVNDNVMGGISNYNHLASILITITRSNLVLDILAQ